MAYYTVGTIVNTHGIRGEVRVMATTDFPESRFKKGKTLYAFKDQAAQTNGVALKIATVRKHKDFILLSFDGKANINDVEGYKTWTLKVDDADRANDELAAGEFYYDQIVGLKVETEDHKLLGTVKEILSPGANDVWVVARKGQSDLLLPYIPQVIKNVDLETGVVSVELMEGLD